MSRHSKRRIPTLAFTKSQDIGWHLNYRDPLTGVPRRRRFGLIDQNEASELYNAWLMVGDDGPRPQVLFYDVTAEPKLVSVFGAKGGIGSPV
jgi:hypothetical protein